MPEYMQELDDLQTVTQPEHVKSNRMAQAARRMRYPVAMCAYSYSLLECFLQAHRLKLPLHTINEHIDLQVRSLCRQGLQPASHSLVLIALCLYLRLSGILSTCLEGLPSLELPALQACK